MFLSDLPAIEIAGLTVGLREFVLALIFFIAVYIGVVLYRMRRISGAEDAMSPLRHAGLEAESFRGDQSGTLAGNNDMSAMTPAPAFEPRNDFSERSNESPLDRADTVRPAHVFGRDATDNAGLANEVAQLRDEVDALRGALAALREDMQEEFTHMRATQSVSPVYGDAMQLAVAGYDAAMIAERCGIARAEAELVVALARSQVK